MTYILCFLQLRGSNIYMICNVIGVRPAPVPPAPAPTMMSDTDAPPTHPAVHQVKFMKVNKESDKSTGNSQRKPAACEISAEALTIYDTTFIAQQVSRHAPHCHPPHCLPHHRFCFLNQMILCESCAQMGCGSPAVSSASMPKQQVHYSNPWIPATIQQEINSTQFSAVSGRKTKVGAGRSNSNTEQP